MSGTTNMKGQYQSWCGINDLPLLYSKSCEGHMAKSMHDNKENKEFPKYMSLRCGQMTEEDIRATVELFGKNYGVWAKNDNPKYIPGKNITMPFEFMKKSIVDKPDRYIAMAYVDDLLVGYAYYMRRKTPSGKWSHGYYSWLLMINIEGEASEQK